MILNDWYQKNGTYIQVQAWRLDLLCLNLEQMQLVIESFLTNLKVRVQLPKLLPSEEDLGSLGMTMESMDERIASRICDFLIFIVHARATCTYDVSSLTVCLIFKYFYSLESATWSEPRFFRCRFLFDFSIQLYQHTTPEPSTMWRNYGCVWDFTPEKHNYVVPFLITPPNKITRSLAQNLPSGLQIQVATRVNSFGLVSLPSPKKRLKKPDQFAFFFEKKMQGGWKLVLRRCPSTESLHANCQTNMGKLWIKG